MKVISLLLTALLGYTTSALACGGTTTNTNQYSVPTQGAEVSIPLGEKEILIINSKSKMLKADSKDSNVIVPLRFELASSSDARFVVVKTQGSTTYLNRFAKYRCINSPAYTNDIYISAERYDSIQIYLLKGKTEYLDEDQKPDLELTSEQILKLLNK